MKSTQTASDTECILNTVQLEHDAEVANGFDTWGRASDFDSLKRKVWADYDFFFRSVGVGNAGPSEQELQRGDEIFQTLQPVLTVQECQELIDEARQVISEGLEKEGLHDDDSIRPTNSQLGEARVSQMPNARQWLRRALHERFFPLLESRFGVSSNDLTLNDALIIGYGYFGGPSKSQPLHRDSDLLSLNCALSPLDDYTGGGTYFDALPANSSILQTPQGHVTCHCGGAQHAGRGIASGERWILVLFCIAKNEPQLARRCHAKGMMERQEGNLQQAEATFRAGLTVAPRDHLLLSSLGGVEMQKGNELTARSLLSASATCYRHDQKPNLALGKMMLDKRRPRAALRRFDRVLEYLNDCDLHENVGWMPLKAQGWDARVHGSRAAIICVQEARRADLDFDCEMHLRRAIERLEIALAAVPGDERILDMLARANELLTLTALNQESLVSS